MPLINVTRKAETLKAYQLTTAADMVTAATYLAARGYSAQIGMTAAGVWDMWLNHTVSNVSQHANLSDWVLVKNNTVAEVVPAAQAADLYQAA